MKKNPAPIEALETRIAPATIFAVNDSNTLFSFDSETPGTLSAGTPITGLGAGELIKAMDFRPATGGLYGIAISGAAAPFTGQLYLIDPATGGATAVGAAFSTALLTNAGYGMDFNPTVDRIRVVNSTEENLRVNPDTGALTTDTNLTGVTALNAIAYTNNYEGTTSTTLYGVNFTNDDLILLGGLNSNPSPNGGVATKVADISVTTASGTGDRLGLDIHTTLEGNTAYYSGVVSSSHNLYTLNLATGGAALLGAIGNGTTPIVDIAVQPAAAFTFPDGKSFTYIDADGDLVTVKTTAGTLKGSQFSWLTSADGSRREIIRMDLAGDATFTGASLTFSAKKTATGGDGRVNIGGIEATGLNLGAVKVGGTLERINAGSNDAVIPAVKSLDVLGYGFAPGANQPGTSISTISGNLPLVKIKGDLIGLNLTITGNVGTALIAGSIIGGDGSSTGYFNILGASKSVTVMGSIIGGDGSSSGSLVLAGQNSIVKVGGSVVGGAGGFSGRILVNPGAKALTTFAVGGSLVGGDGGTSGTISFGVAKAVTIGGSVVAGDGTGSGNVAGTSAVAFKLAGSIIGGVGANSASVAPGAVGTFTLGGSLIGGQPASDRSGQLHFTTAKAVLIKGGVIGQPGPAPALIGFAGKSAPATAAESIAVASLTIKGSVANAEILFGEGFPGTIDKGDVAAGKISIGGDFLASSISAGIARGGDGAYGTTDDVVDANANLRSAIASIVIKGRATGTPSDGDQYGIVAEKLSSVMIAGRKLALNATAQDNVLLGAYADLRLRDVAIP